MLKILGSLATEDSKQSSCDFVWGGGHIYAYTYVCVYVRVFVYSFVLFNTCAYKYIYIYVCLLAPIYYKLSCMKSLLLGVGGC